MKRLFFAIALVVTATSCKEDVKKMDTTTEVSETKIETKKSETIYPKAISKVFKAHGGLDNWKAMNNLCFQMEGRGGKEIHTTSLKDRKTKIENEKWSIGYDGSDVWLLQNEEEAYKGNARFYHNLMFYFYAMPFVGADDGIIYTDLPQTELMGKSYTTTKIGYKANVGDSPDDEYIIYSDPTTNQMEWLAYTVTYGKDGKSDSFKYIKYDEWMTVNGLVLPKKLSWYNVENNKPVSERNDMLFENVTVSKAMLEDTVFAKPDVAIVVEK